MAEGIRHPTVRDMTHDYFRPKISRPGESSDGPVQTMEFYQHGRELQKGKEKNGGVYLTITSIHLDEFHLIPNGDGKVRGASVPTWRRILGKVFLGLRVEPDTGKGRDAWFGGRRKRSTRKGACNGGTDMPFITA